MLLAPKRIGGKNIAKKNAQKYFFINNEENCENSKKKFRNVF
jgi:hypothetical protein